MARARPLRPDEIELLHRVLSNEVDVSVMEDILPRAVAGQLAREERKKLCEMINGCFSQWGTDENWETTRLGQRLKDLADLILAVDG